jgi:hypothetical protein
MIHGAPLLPSRMVGLGDGMPGGESLDVASGEASTSCSQIIGSAVDPTLHVCRVPVACDVDLICGRGDLLEVCRGELDVGGGGVFL